MTLNRIANIQVSVGVATVIVGILLIVGPGSELFSAYEHSIAIGIGNVDSISEVHSSLIHWLLATCGAGVVGWGIAWIMISHIPLRRGEVWSYRCLWISLFAWALLDILIACWFGVTGEILFVLSAFFTAAFPLFLARRVFVS